MQEVSSSTLDLRHPPSFPAQKEEQWDELLGCQPPAVAATQYYSLACRYLVHMVQLDAAAMNLKRRFEDPNITASLEAQQAYTRALAPGGDCCFPTAQCSTPAPRIILLASGVRDAQYIVGRLPPVPEQCSAWLVRRADASITGQTAAGASTHGSVMANTAVPHGMSCLQLCSSV